MMKTQDLVKNVFGSEDERTWYEWVSFMKPEWKDLYEIIAGNYKIFFKKRAILVLLAPNSESIPFYWKESGLSGSDKHWCDGEYLKTLNLELLGYTANLIKIFHKEVMALDESEEKHRALRYYNGCILKLLSKKMSEETSRDLISLYFESLILFLRVGEYPSGFFFGLFRKAKIDIKSKKRMDDQIRQLLLNESVNPEINRDKLFCIYVETIDNLLVFEKSLWEQEELLADQIDFVVSNLKKFGKYFFKNYFFGNSKFFRFYQFLERKEINKEKRLELAKKVLSYGYEKRKIQNRYQIEVVKRILIEFSDSDKKFARALKIIIKKGEERLEQERQKTLERERRDEAILAKMMI